MRRPNIVLLTVECWRGDHFGELTPHLARFGEESAVFDNAQVLGGWTLPSMTGMMSSAYPSMHGGPVVAMASPARKALAECLLDAGYWTAGITANGVCGVMKGFHRGFGYFRQVVRKIPAEFAIAAESRHDWARLEEMGISPADLETFAAAPEVSEVALRWLDRRNTEEPFFLWIHYMDPHWPFLTPDRPSTAAELGDAWTDRHVLNEKLQPSFGRCDLGETGRRWKHRYRQAVQIVDEEIGALIAHLKNRADWNETIVAATGDHGEEFYEHGTWLHQWNQLYREGIHVPLIVRIPGVEPGRIASVVSHLDLAPTLLDYAGVSQPAAMMGRSLRPCMEDGDHPARTVYTEMLGHPRASRYLLAIRTDEWKYIHDFENPHAPKLFNLTNDPDERHNVMHDFPQLYRRFEEMKLEHFTRGLVRFMSRSDLTAKAAADDDAVREQLHALGYI